MKIINGLPPNFEKIVSVFPIARRPGTIFAYGDAIYSLSSKWITSALVAHETVHLERQQLMGVEKWWDRYLEDTEFRFNEELLAHRAEYNFMIKADPSRGNRRRAVKIVAGRLASALYGKVVTETEAKQLLTDKGTTDDNDD